MKNIGSILFAIFMHRNSKLISESRATSSMICNWNRYISRQLWMRYLISLPLLITIRLRRKRIINCCKSTWSGHAQRHNPTIKTKFIQYQSSVCFRFISILNWKNLYFVFSYEIILLKCIFIIACLFKWFCTSCAGFLFGKTHICNGVRYKSGG